MSALYSGVGGQVDFVRGAARSSGGRPILALPATAKNGTVSRIQVDLQPGSGVTTTRSDVHYVVTEHGIAELKGRTLAERARQEADSDSDEDGAEEQQGHPCGRGQAEGVPPQAGQDACGGG